MRIGIIGATSQVGSSVAFHLTKYPGTEVVCFARSTYGHIYFNLLKIPVEHINLDDIEDLRLKFKDLDALIDFSYPTGQLIQIKKSIKRNLQSIITCMPKQTVFIYMSSIMAYGMPPTNHYISNVMFPASSYSYFKRYAENLALSFGRRYNVYTYNFRLGQVHGLLQSVTRSIRQKLTKSNSIYIYGNPSDLTNTIFTSSIADAVMKCINDKVTMGTYTLVSSPQWKLKELYEFYLNYYNCDSDLIFVPTEKERASILSILLKVSKNYRLLLETYILLKMPLMSLKLKGKYRVNEVANLANQKKINVKEIELNLLGVPSLRILPTQNSTPAIVKESEQEFELHYNNVVLNNRS